MHIKEHTVLAELALVMTVNRTFVDTMYRNGHMAKAWNGCQEHTHTPSDAGTLPQACKINSLNLQSYILHLNAYAY